MAKISKGILGYFYLKFTSKYLFTDFMKFFIWKNYRYFFLINGLLDLF